MNSFKITANLVADPELKKIGYLMYDVTGERWNVVTKSHRPKPEESYISLDEMYDITDQLVPHLIELGWTPPDDKRVGGGVPKFEVGDKTNLGTVDRIKTVERLTGDKTSVFKYVIQTAEFPMGPMNTVDEHELVRV